MSSRSGDTPTQRRELAGVLGTLREDEWAHDSLCAGWTVKDVAAHVISTPKLRGWPFWRAVLRGRGQLDRIGLLDGQFWGRAPVAEILADFERYDGSRAHPHFVTPMEPLTDVLVHTQDLLRPLGRSHEMPVEAAVAAADRTIAQHLKVLHGPNMTTVRLVATDIDWAAGTGPEVRGPIQELLMIVAGRPADAALLSGEGTRLVKTDRRAR